MKTVPVLSKEDIELLTNIEKEIMDLPSFSFFEIHFVSAEFIDEGIAIKLGCSRNSDSRMVRDIVNRFLSGKDRKFLDIAIYKGSKKI